jgi:hypothetical protein
VLLLDEKDATDAHRSDDHVIVTDSGKDTWDATECKGIKSSYSLKGTKNSTTVGIYVILCIHINIHLKKRV